VEGGVMAAGAPIEAKAGAATAATFIAGELVVAIFTFWPAAAGAISPDARLQLQATLATILTAAAGYFAAHTHRPDLAPVPPPPGMVATTTWAPGAAPPPVRVTEQPPPDAGDSD
jgi:hypothetical protein